MSDNKDKYSDQDFKKKSRIRKIRSAIIIVVIVALIVVLWHVFTPEEAVSVLQARQVKKLDLSESISLSGTVVPSKTQEVEYKDIPVKELLVKPGDRVSKGDRLLTYDLSQLRSDLKDLQESRDEANETLEASQQDLQDLMSDMQAGMGISDLTDQLQYMTGDLTGGLSQLANGMLSIGTPFQQLVDRLDQADIKELIALLESLSTKGDELMEVLTDPELRDNLQAALDEMSQRLNDLEDLLSEIIEQLPEIEVPEIPDLPTFPTDQEMPATSPVTTENETTSTDNSETDLEPNLRRADSDETIPLKKSLESGMAVPLASALSVDVSDIWSAGNLDISSEDLKMLMQQFSSIPGASDYLESYMQGAQLVKILDEQVEEQERLLKEASKHETADFDALVAEAQRDLSDMDTKKSLIVLYDEKTPQVHARVTRKDALLLAKGQSAKYTTDKLDLVGEVIFKSPIATTSPVNSSGSVDDLFSQFFGGSSESSLIGGEARVDIELSMEGPDIDKVIFGFDISFNVDVAEETAVLALPSESILSERNQTYVYLLGENNKLELCPVELGISTSDHSEIISGLSEGDWVIINPAASLQEGVRYNAERLGE